MKLKYGPRAAALMLLAAGAGVIGPNTPAAESHAELQKSAVAETNLMVTSIFLVAPDASFQGLDLKWQPLASGGTIAVATAPEANIACRALTNAPGTRVLQKPRVITSAGTTGTIEIGGTNRPSGITFQVTPFLAGPAWDLKLAAELREPVNAKADPAMQEIRTTRIEATPHVERDQTVVIRHSIAGAGGDEPQSLVVFVTPIPVQQRLQRIIKRIEPEQRR